MKRKILFIMTLFIIITTAKAQFYSARTNLVGLATGNINLELSMTLNRDWTAHIPVQYNPFVLNNNRQFRNLTAMPGVRYWFQESYINNFIGMYAVASRYHFGQIWDDKRYDGQAYGVGFSYGKSYQLSTRWNFEWELGAGVVWSEFEKYKCKKCGQKLGKENGIYLVPTRIAANIIYLF